MDRDAVVQLMGAEQEAQQVVYRAKAERDAKLRNAAEEAKSEIQEYQDRRTAELHQLEEQVAKEVADGTRDVELETGKRVAAFETGIATRLEDVAELLFKVAITVDL